MSAIPARGVLLLPLFASVVFAISGRTEPACGTMGGANMSCYTCLGRDSENCESGTTCCAGSCFKLIDEEHDLIAKGCTSQREEDGSMKKRTLDVTLYWAGDQKISGESYFCSSSDYCNESVSVLLSTSLLASILLLLVL